MIEIETKTRRQRLILRKIYSMVAFASAFYLVSAFMLLLCSSFGFDSATCSGFVRLVLESLLASQQDPSRHFFAGSLPGVFMTTGSTFTILQGVNVDSPQYTTEFKTWSGGDGKYDANGRLRYNTYSMSRLYSERQKNGLGFILDPAVDIGFPVIWDDNDTLFLQQKLLSNVKRHSFNLAVATGEGRQTLKLVSNTALTFYHTIKDLKRGNLTSAVRRLGGSKKKGVAFLKQNGSGVKRVRHDLFAQLDDKVVANRWLELQYGWLPLLSDCYEASQAYHSIAEKPRTTSYRVAKRKHSVDTVNYTKGPCNRVTTEIRSIKYTQTEVLSTPRQLGLTDPLSLAWELLPFSFIADWFIPIGTYFDNLAQIPHLAGSFGNGRLYKSSIRESGVSLWDGMNCSALSVQCSRDTGNLTVPLPTFKPWAKALSPLHMQNSVALLRSIF